MAEEGASSNMTQKDIDKPRINLLAKILCGRLKGSDTSSEGLARELSVDRQYVESVCRGLADEGLMVEKGDGGWTLTELGRSRLVVVFAGGVFDIIHPGHIFTLSSAKKLGDVLVVSVARDKTVRRSKGRDPLNDESKRVELVGSLRYVDVALLGSETDIFDTVEKVGPDIIALGYDQKHNEGELAAEAERKGLRLKVVRLGSPMPNIKSSDIISNSEVVKEF